MEFSRQPSTVLPCKRLKNYLLTIWVLPKTKIMCWEYVQLTMTWGAAVRTPMVARIVNKLKVMRHIRSSTIAANFQSFSTEAALSSFRILLLITWISFSILTSSRWIPERAKCSKVGGGAADVLKDKISFLKLSN